jgi:hypothetical protein
MPHWFRPAPRKGGESLRKQEFPNSSNVADITNCIDYLKKKYNIQHVKYLVAPHHGTHWVDTLFDISTRTVIICDGKKEFPVSKRNIKQ